MKPGKLALVLGLPIALGGIGFALGRLGYVSIPGITPPAPEAQEEEQPEQPPVEMIDFAPEQEEAAQPSVPPVQTDEEQGAKTLARVWNDIDARQLLPVAERYRDQELAQVLLVMESKKTAELLALMPPDRAAKLSQEIQDLASIVKSDATL